MNKKKDRLAFTLAEVFITLGIIGVVAAMTIPGVIKNYDKRSIASQWAKFYSNMYEAYNLAKINYGESIGWGIYERLSNPDIEKIFVDNLKGKFCYKTFNHKYSDYLNNVKEHSGIYNPSAFDTSTSQCIVLPNGTIVMSYNYNKMDYDINLTHFVVDVNGLSKPNKYMKDIHVFYILHSTNLKRKYGFNSTQWNSSMVFSPVDKPGIYPGGYQGGGTSICNKSNKMGCTLKFIGDGWVFKSDYPW